MTGYGIRQEDQCALLRISRPTLEKHFRRELDTGATEANMRVVQSLYTNATRNMSVQAQIWWTKTRMGWKDTSEVALGGSLAVDIHWADATPKLNGHTHEPLTIEIETEYADTT
jgi:hypothetical protein